MKFALSICLLMISAGVCGALPALERRGIPGLDSTGLDGATGPLKNVVSGLLKRQEKFVGPDAESLPPTKGGIRLSTSKRAVFERQANPTDALATVEGLVGTVGGGALKRQANPTDALATVEGLVGTVGGGALKRQANPTDALATVEGLVGTVGGGALKRQANSTDALATVEGLTDIVTGGGL